MIDFRTIEETIRASLENWLRSKGFTCPVILANQASPSPPYPYLSYTVTTPQNANMKQYSVSADGTRYKPLVQTWSFTVQSADNAEALEIALQAHDWFELIGNTYLSDNGIVAQRVGSISNRDNMISIQYEYRRGFDVDFLLMFTISGEDSETAGYIETATVTRTD